MTSSHPQLATKFSVQRVYADYDVVVFFPAQVNALSVVLPQVFIYLTMSEIIRAAVHKIVAQTSQRILAILFALLKRAKFDCTIFFIILRWHGATSIDDTITTLSKISEQVAGACIPKLIIKTTMNLALMQASQPAT